MHPAKRVSEIHQYPPRQPKTGWRIWRDAAFFVPTRVEGYWHIELWLDGKLTQERLESTHHRARQQIQTIINNLDEETKRKIRLYEAFNEAAD